MTGAHDPDALAKQRFAILSLMRLAGVGLVIMGLLVMEQIVPWPQIIGYPLIAIGLFDVFYMPALLARRWRKPGS